MSYIKGDRVRLTETIYIGTLPSLLYGCMGTVEAVQDDTPYPIHVRWDGNILFPLPHLCGVAEDEIELVNHPEKIYSEPLSGG